MKSARQVSFRTQYQDNPVSIKYYVKSFILQNRERFENRIVIDTPGRLRNHLANFERGGGDGLRLRPLSRVFQG